MKIEHDKLAKVLAQIRPGAEWNLREQEDGTQSIEWLDQTQTEPSSEELEQGVAAIEAQKYRELRAVAYPSIGDQLDALWKGGTAADDMKAAVMAVKATYPKPT